MPSCCYFIKVDTSHWIIIQQFYERWRNWKDTISIHSILNKYKKGDTNSMVINKRDTKALKKTWTYKFLSITHLPPYLVSIFQLKKNICLLTDKIKKKWNSHLKRWQNEIFMPLILNFRVLEANVFIRIP